MAIKQELKELIRNSVQAMLNKLLEQESSELLKAGRHERTEVREGYQTGHYDRHLTTTSGDVKLKMPKLKEVAFEKDISFRYESTTILTPRLGQKIFAKPSPKSINCTHAALKKGPELVQLFNLL